MLREGWGGRRGGGQAARRAMWAPRRATQCVLGMARPISPSAGYATAPTAAGKQGKEIVPPVRAFTLNLTPADRRSS
jgi:hypothetical protein